MGYTENEIKSVPGGANMGLGCGNPQAIAALKEGMTVVDLGSGGGFDCFLSGKMVGPKGHVIGVDMTPSMLRKARAAAAKAGPSYAHVEFRLGEIEHLPIANNTVDVIISNCVVNLSTAKEKVCRDAFRVLRSGGRIAWSDVVAWKPLPPKLRDDPRLICGCMGGASVIGDLEKMLKDAGFTEVKVEPKLESKEMIRGWAPGTGIEEYCISA